MSGCPWVSCTFPNKLKVLQRSFSTNRSARVSRLKRRWGYYTVPILYQDRLVAWANLRLEREAKALVVKGFWLEEHLILDDAFLLALTRGFQRFMQFVGAEGLDGTMLSPDVVRKSILERMRW